MIHKIRAVQSTLTQTNEWLHDLCQAYDFADEEKAFVLLRAVLKTLRDRISPDEAFQLASSLPALIRGYYFEGWNFHKHPTREKHALDFITTVRKNLAGHEDIDLEMAVPETMRIIFERIDQGEARQVKGNLPPEIRDIIA